MKSVALSALMLILLTACATAPRPVQILEACPRVPYLELDVPELAWQDWMQSFLQGTPLPLPDSKPLSTPALPPTTK